MTLFHNILGAALKPAVQFTSRRRLPQYDGRLYLPGLHTGVTVTRDEWGIPHLWAANRHDLFFAQGVVQAQERLWQMEINRRAATGRLAALFGESVLESDRLTRTMGFARLAAASLPALPANRRAELQAYTDGVNAYLASNPPLPVEFSLVGHRPEPWQLTDTLAFSRLQSWAMSTGWAGELVRAQLQERVGPHLASQLDTSYAPTNPATLPAGIEFNQLTLDGLLKTIVGPFLGKGSLDGAGRGSNGWVIAASKSATGHAILANDVHLPLSTPSIWFYMHLHSADGYQAAGVSQAGAPYILIGHNAHIAWGITLAFTDVEDLFIEKLDDTGRYYQFGDDWRPLTVVEERIEIKGKPDFIEPVRLSHHGPIVSDLLATGNQVLSMASMALRPDTNIEGFAALNEAQTWDDFVAAMRFIESPPLNIVYADRQDNIGYWVTGRVPIRASGHGLLPTPGWTAQHEWLGEIPFEQMPHALNPACGYLITCNNRIVGDNYPHYLGSVWMNGYRARRLEQLISQQEKISLDDCRRFQFDFYSIPGRELTDRLAQLQPTDPDASLSLGLLRQWDGWLGSDSVGGAVYKVLVYHLAHLILDEKLGPDLSLKLLGKGEHPLLHPTNEFFGYWTVNLLRLLDNPDSDWWGGRPEAILQQALSQTTQTLRQRLGDAPDQWQWGRLHQVTFAHVLGVQPPLDQIFNQGPVPIGGDTDTVNQTAIRPESPYHNNAFSVSYRQIIDLSDFNNCQAMYAPGQSGHLASPHYGDLIQPWLTGGYFPIPWDTPAIPHPHSLLLSPSPS